MDQSSTTQNRRSRRSNLLMTATLEIAGRVLPVKLRNLSADGARVEGAELPVEGTRLLFRKGELAIDGRVIWVRGKQAGVA
ncbi:MAG: PilZ domain-containing protein, partial [Sphingomonas bacterium]|nr:PilZ domain-containing protein [Sphingomonas bacterium]